MSLLSGVDMRVVKPRTLPLGWDQRRHFFLSILRASVSCLATPRWGGWPRANSSRKLTPSGGIMGINTDKTAIQYRRLNSSKGPAVRSSRAQCDKALYAQRMQEFLGNGPESRDSRRRMRVRLFLTEGRVTGVRCKDGSEMRSASVIITSGTFLRAVMHTGFDQAERRPGRRSGGTGSECKFRASGLSPGTAENGDAPAASSEFDRLCKVEAAARG